MSVWMLYSSVLCTYNINFGEGAEKSPSGKELVARLTIRSDFNQFVVLVI